MNTEGKWIDLKKRRPPLAGKYAVRGSDGTEGTAEFITWRSPEEACWYAPDFVGIEIDWWFEPQPSQSIKD